MDRERFDELTRLLATKGSRRSALGAILSVALLGREPEDGAAKPGKGKGKGHGKGRGKGHDKDRDKGKSKGHPERDEPAELAAQDTAPAPEDVGPDVQAEGQGGGRGKSKGRGKTKGKGKNRKGSDQKNSGERDQNAQAATTTCCGTKSCAKPTVGSNRAQCNFAGQNLSGKKYTSSNFGKIDGRRTNFNNANVRSANFGEACLQGATFRGADVLSANFGGACLFGADFTGAKNLNVTVNFALALLCGTKLPDATVSDRDCDKPTPCCGGCSTNGDCGSGKVCCSGTCESGDCCGNGDCPANKPICVNNTCGPCTSNSQCGNDKVCCNGVCCTAGQVCDTSSNPDICCTPRTKDQTCDGKCGDVIDNCGQTVGCGECAERLCQTGSCSGSNNTCAYTAVGNNQQGPLCDDRGEFCCGGDECCTAGQACFNNNCCTPAENTCRNKCGNVVNNCGQTIACGACAVETCQTGACTGANNTCDYTPVGNGQQGPKCDDAGESCCGGRNCCTSGQVCDTRSDPDSCCTPDDKLDTCRNTCGMVTNNCGQSIDCGDCAVVTCQNGVCDASDSTCDYTPVDNGQPGPDCRGTGQFCCGGKNCCTQGQVCDTSTDPDSCCTPDEKSDTCLNTCGVVANNCGERVDCGDCAVVTCQTGLCDETDSRCDYTPVANGQQGPNCDDAGEFCCGGTNCCVSGQVCDTRPQQDVCCTPISSCPSNACGNVPDGCGGTVPCGPCAVRTCQDGSCTAQNTCEYANSTDNLPGPNCDVSGRFCCDGDCCASGDVCLANGCCTPQSFNTTCGVGSQAPKCGNVTNNCGQTVNCGPCAVRTCKSGLCNDATDTCEYTNQPNGQPGNQCTTQCCNGICCTSDQNCVGGICKKRCTSSSQCGSGGVCCGGVCETGNCCSSSNCPSQDCKAKVCTNFQCVYTNVPDGTDPGDDCSGSLTCFNGTCGCATASNCQNKNCKTKACTDHQCVYTNVPDGTDPDDDCSGSKRCCNGTCQSSCDDDDDSDGDDVDSDDSDGDDSDGDSDSGDGDGDDSDDSDGDGSDDAGGGGDSEG